MGLPFGAACLLAFLSAFLLYLAFPHPHISGFVWVAALPFYLACRFQGPVRGAVLGLLFGCAFQYSLLSWATVFGTAAQVALVLYKAVAPALLGALLGSYRPPTPLHGALFGAAAWVGMEYFQILGPLGMTWGMLSHTQSRILPWIQIGELFGPWGLSFAIAFWNAALAELFWRRKRALTTVGAAAGLLAVIFSYGIVRLQHPWGNGHSLTWGVVQTSMPQDQRWDPSFREEIMGRLDRLTRESASQGARLILWPETSVPYPFFLETWPLRSRVGGLAQSLQSFILTGSIERASEPNATRNVATLVAPDGELLATAEKIRLVPFGEYLPLPRFMRDWPIFDRVMRYVPGTQHVIFPDPTSFGVLICYESMVPHEPRKKVERGAGVLAVITNDAWFGKSSAAMHHFEMAIMRAVEMRRPVVQCGNNGISGFILPTGEVMVESGLDEVVQLTREVRPETYRTIYSRTGDLLAYLCLAMMLWLIRLQLGERTQCVKS